MRFPFALLLLALISATGAIGGEAGRSQETVVLKGMPVTVFTYRPAGCQPNGLLFVFHGVSRNADDYRDYAIPLADRACLIVLAPLFDKDRFPGWRYQRGGVVRKGQVRPRTQWTVTLVADLVAWGRGVEGRADMPYFLFGHSAGGQFLSRVAAFAAPPDVSRIVIANPSSHVMPSLTEDVPYGFAGVFSDGESEGALRRYLGLPVTLYLGEADTGRPRLLNNRAARRQGENRLERGRHVYQAAVEMARLTGWACNWKLVIVPEIGHSSRRMLSAPQAFETFGIPP